MSNKKNDTKSSGKYVVIRNGHRVSDAEYTTKNEAINEYEHWMRVISRWPDNSKIEIVELN